MESLDLYDKEVDCQSVSRMGTDREQVTRVGQQGRCKGGGIVHSRWLPVAHLIVGASEAQPQASINRIQRTALRPAVDAERVCQTWHRASGVKVPTPGIRRAEG